MRMPRELARMLCNVTDQMHRTLDVPVHPQRIISLVPSQTELLYDLGLGERVVGITKFCVHPETSFKTKHRVGGTKKIDIDKVRALMPDLIIGNKEENERADIEALEKEFPVWMSDVHHLRDAVNMIAEVGHLTGTLDRANDLLRGIAREFDELKSMEYERSVAYLIWRDPFMVAGGDTFISDMLSRCGLLNVFNDRQERYAEVTPVDLIDAAPDVLLLSSEPFPFTEKHVAEFAALLPKAQVIRVDGEMFSWYGSRLLKAPAYFGSIIDRLRR